MSEQNPASQRGVPEDLERLLAAEVSLRSRMGHLAVGLAGGCVAALIAVLWATEPDPLPARTRAAFAGLIVIGLAWAVFAGWVLSRRRPLFARDKVLGAWLALMATAASGVAGTALAAARASTSMALTTALVGLSLIAAAATLLARAQSRRRELLHLRNALTQDSS